MKSFAGGLNTACVCLAIVTSPGVCVAAAAAASPDAAKPATELKPAPAVKPASTVKPDAAYVEGVAKLLDDSLTLLAQRSSQKDSQYYEKGVWHFPNESKAWAVQGGLGTAAAVLWKWRQRHGGPADPAGKARQEWLHSVAVETFDRALHDHQHPDGSFDDPKRPDTHFFALELATTYLELRDSLDAATRERWLTTLRQQIDYLIKTNDLPNAALHGWQATDGWYTNGNIELGEAELVYLAAKATGEPKYRDLFERQWAHTLRPSPLRWKGYGLVYVKEPTRADGSDGAAYLTESGGSLPGYDGDYTHFQVTVASRLYVESRDPRVLRLLNLLINATLPHLDRKTWVLDATHGSRHSLKFPYYTSGLAVAAWLGGRADLAPLLPDQFAKAIEPVHLGNAQQNWGNPAIVRSYGVNLAVLLQAAAAAGD